MPLGPGYERCDAGLVAAAAIEGHSQSAMEGSEGMAGRAGPEGDAPCFAPFTAPPQGACASSEAAVAACCEVGDGRELRTLLLLLRPLAMPPLSAVPYSVEASSNTPALPATLAPMLLAKLELRGSFLGTPGPEPNAPEGPAGPKGRATGVPDALLTDDDPPRTTTSTNAEPKGARARGVLVALLGPEGSDAAPMDGGTATDVGAAVDASAAEAPVVGDSTGGAFDGDITAMARGASTGVALGGGCLAERIWASAARGVTTAPTPLAWDGAGSRAGACAGGATGDAGAVCVMPFVCAMPFAPLPPGLWLGATVVASGVGRVPRTAASHPPVAAFG